MEWNEPCSGDGGHPVNQTAATKYSCNYWSDQNCELIVNEGFVTEHIHKNSTTSESWKDKPVQEWTTYTV